VCGSAADADAPTTAARPGVFGAPAGNACATAAAHRSSLWPWPPLGTRAPRPCGFVDSTTLRAESTTDDNPATVGFSAAGPAAASLTAMTAGLAALQRLIEVAARE